MTYKAADIKAIVTKDGAIVIAKAGPMLLLIPRGRKNVR
jgi:hypothetical protein